MSLFPWTNHSSQRYALNGNGQPQLLCSQTIWGIVGLATADYRIVIDTLASVGIPMVTFGVLWHDPRSTWVPTAGNGALPFLKTLAGATWTGTLWPSAVGSNLPDFTTWNQAYFDHVNAIIDYAASKSEYCNAFVAYSGRRDDSGWMNELLAQPAGNCQAYANYFAGQIATRPNVSIGLGGDLGTGSGAFTSPELVVENELLAGIRSGGPARNFTSEWTSPTFYTQQTDATLAAAGSWQSCYSFASATIISEVRAAYASSPTLPSNTHELPFDGEGPPPGNSDNTDATEPIHRFQAYSQVEGSAGTDLGNAPLWYGNTATYATGLNTQAMLDFGRMIAMLKTINWHLLVPSAQAGMRTLITPGTASQTIVSSAAVNGSAFLVYSGPDGNAGTFTFDLGAATGVRFRWYNRASGVYSTGGGALGTFTQSGTPTFTPPGSNGAGFNDWWLVGDTPAPADPGTIFWCG